MSSPSTPACDGTPRRLTSRTNCWLDLLTAFAFAAMAGTGVLQRWVLPRGSSKARLTWLGFGRHDWANIHFWLSTLILALIILHLALHWSWIRACWRRFLGLLCSPLTWVVLLALVVLPLVIPPRTAEPGDGTGWQEDGPRTGQGAHGRGQGRPGE